MGLVRVLTTPTLLPANSQLLPSQQSWSYHLTAGADFNAADYHAVVSRQHERHGVGSLLLGKDYGNNVFGPSGTIREHVQRR